MPEHPHAAVKASHNVAAVIAIAEETTAISQASGQREQDFDLHRFDEPPGRRAHVEDIRHRLGVGNEIGLIDVDQPGARAPEGGAPAPRRHDKLLGDLGASSKGVRRAAVAPSYKAAGEELP